MAEKKMTQRALQAMQRREELLQSAKTLFAEYGYHATTTKSITQAIGMADGLIYHYFPGGKEEMLLTMMKEEIEKKVEGSKELLAKLNRDTPIREMLYEMGKVILNAATRDKDLLSIFLRESHILNREIQSTFIEPFSELLGHLKQYLSYKTEQGLLKELDADFMVIQFVSSFTFFFLQQNVNFGKPIFFNWSEEELLQHLVQHTLKTWEK